MKTLLTRAFLSTAIGMGVAAGLVRADERLSQATPPPNGSQPRGQAVPLSPSITQGSFVPTPTVVEAEAPSKRRPFHNWLQKHGYCCTSDMNDFGCGSFHSDWKFVFGSCREFFGEPCFKAPKTKSSSKNTDCRCP